MPLCADSSREKCEIFAGPAWSCWAPRSHPALHPPPARLGPSALPASCASGARPVSADPSQPRPAPSEDPRGEQCAALRCAQCPRRPTGYRQILSPRASRASPGPPYGPAEPLPVSVRYYFPDRHISPARCLAPPWAPPPRPVIGCRHCRAEGDAPRSWYAKLCPGCLLWDVAVIYSGRASRSLPRPAPPPGRGVASTPHTKSFYVLFCT